MHQRVNTHVFRDPLVLMQTWLRVTEHVRAALAREGEADLERRCLRAVPARGGAPFHTDASGRSGARSRSSRARAPSTCRRGPREAEAAARAFGAFAAQLADLDPASVPESIPHFHDFAHRVAAFETAAAGDAHGRAGAAAREIEEARRLAAEVERALAHAGAARLPVRVVHNDCKLNNLLFDDRTGEALCVIDLDTVMPGTCSRTSATSRAPPPAPRPRTRPTSGACASTARSTRRSCAATSRAPARCSSPSRSRCSRSPAR